MDKMKLASTTVEDMMYRVGLVQSNSCVVSIGDVLAIQGFLVQGQNVTASAMTSMLAQTRITIWWCMSAGRQCPMTTRLGPTAEGIFAVGDLASHASTIAQLRFQIQRHGQLLREVGAAKPKAWVAQDNSRLVSRVDWTATKFSIAKMGFPIVRGSGLVRSRIGAAITGESGVLGPLINVPSDAHSEVYIIQVLHARAD